ncbi:MAG TPA: chitobiase/beta-hexosaminidase C-terminal domain-containing protein [Terriglobales bacterium]|nr:chitobiase/beta-hexosaminidase C-terminal domain-containing protein [Terriglobales bacterium]
MALIPLLAAYTKVGGQCKFNISTSLPYTQVVNAAPSVTTTTLSAAPNPSQYGQTVTLTATVSGGSATPTGTVTFLDGAVTLGTGTLNAGTAALSISTLTAGNHTIVARYEGDASHAVSTSTALTQVVNQAVPTILWATPADIVYGTPLGAAQLNATANLPGMFVYSPAAGSVLNAGTQTLSASFTPTDSLNYSIATAQVQLNVLKFTPTVTATGGTFTYDGSPKPGAGSAIGMGGVNLTPVTLTYVGTGSTVYGPTATAPTEVGSYSVTADYAGDANNNAATSAAAALTITSVTATITLSNLTQTYDGTPKAVTATTSPAGLSVTLTYDGSTTQPIHAGSYSVFASIDNPNYTGSATGTLIIEKAIPSVTWATPANITYGISLGAAQLNASSTQPGTFLYTPAPGTILGAGTQTLSVTFTPTDQVNYASKDATTQIVVEPATIVVTVPSASRVYGDPEPAFVPQYTGFVNGETVAVLTATAMCSTSATLASPITSGSNPPYAITCAGAGAANYTFTYAQGQLTVMPTTLIVTPHSYTRPEGEPNPVLAGTISGVKNNDPITALYSTTATASSPVGTYPITATVSDGGTGRLANYNLTLENGTLNVLEKQPTKTTLPTPVITPSVGVFTSPQTVTITSSTTGALIYYTTNGTTPTEASTLYTGSFTVSSTTTIKAIATASGYNNSWPATATVNIDAVAPVITPSVGAFNSPQTVTIISSTPGTSIYYTINGTTPTEASTLYTAPFTVSSTTTIKAIASGGGYGNSWPTTATVTINAVAPVITPSVGVFTSPQTVTITSSSPGASIYYTTNGTTPTEASTLYTGPFTVSSTTTVKAIAAGGGYGNSWPTTATVTINAVAPVIKPSMGVFTSPQTATITSTTPGTSIYYTTNGTTPTKASTLYTGPFTVSSTTTIKAIATGGGYGNSWPTSATITIK